MTTSSPHARLGNHPVWDPDGSTAFPELRGAVEADLCVVGLGGTGLAAVEEGLSRGLEVVGLDAASVASGAAGRNGGFLLGGVALFHHDAALRLGADRATSLYRATLAEIERILSADRGIARRSGSLRIAATSDELEDCEGQLERMLADGLPVEGYRGEEGRGLLFPADAVCDPLALCRAAAQRASSAGARLFERSEVIEITAEGVSTGSGSVACGAVVVAVDGGLEAVLPELTGLVRTARLQMIATAPSTEVTFPRPVYRRYGFEYLQQLPNGRLALGGFRDVAGQGEWTLDAEPADPVQSLLEGWLRELGVTAPVTHRWAARAGFSRGPLPTFAKLRGGVVAVGGFNGTGNVVGRILGREAVGVALGDPGEASGLFDLVSV